MRKIILSNNRILNVDNNEVKFSYNDYSDGGKRKIMTLSATEFLRRFCLHILPKKFRKIRHYGFLASRNKKKLRELQEKMSIPKLKNDTIIYINPDCKAKRCPCCSNGGRLLSCQKITSSIDKTGRVKKQTFLMT